MPTDHYPPVSPLQYPGGYRWSQGTADAVRQFLWILEDIRNSRTVEDILILPADQLVGEGVLLVTMPMGEQSGLRLRNGNHSSDHILNCARQQLVASRAGRLSAAGQRLHRSLSKLHCLLWPTPPPTISKAGLMP
jgi:hypothetical protein